MCVCVRLKLQQLNSADTAEHCSVTQNQRERTEGGRECTQQRGNTTARPRQSWREDISQLKRRAGIVKCLPFILSLTGYTLI